jgi:excisionase family DNA binding protein
MLPRPSTGNDGARRTGYSPHDVHYSGGPRAYEEPITPLLLTVRQAGQLLGIGRSTVYELMETGEIRSVKRGASRRIPLKAVHEYIDRLLADEDQGGPFPSPS